MVLPVSRQALLDITTMTLAHLYDRVLNADRHHSPVFVPLLCAATGMAHPGIARVSALMTPAVWTPLVAAVAMALEHAGRLPIPWGNLDGQPYVQDHMQEELLFASGIDGDVIGSLIRFCASLP